jgi:branched-chain amino acid transport system permease protein
MKGGSNIAKQVSSAEKLRERQIELRQNRRRCFHFFTGTVTVIVGIVVLPFLLSMSLAIDIVILAVAATAFNLLLGYAGLLSFGQAAFFALGGYAAGNAMLHLGASALPSLALAAVAGAAGAFLVGLLTMRLRNVYFVLMTLAFAQLVYYLALSMRQVTGGSSGLRGFDRPNVVLGPVEVDLSSGLSMYAFASIVFLICLGVTYRLTSSPMGLVLRGVRENQERLEAIGYSVGRFKLLAFAIAGAMTGLAGALYAMQWQIVPISVASMDQSAAIVFMSILGGVGHPLGPALGAVVYTWLADVIAVQWARWPLVFGLIILLILLFLTGGLIEGMRRLFAYLLRVSVAKGVR